jgi:hypothetical protein
VTHAQAATTEAEPVDLRPVGQAAVLGAVITALIVAMFVWSGARIGEVEGDPYIRGFPTEGALNVMLAQGDGQAYLALAEDPGLQRPERFQGPAGAVAAEAEMAYWAQRPLLPYATVVLSAGQAEAAPYAMIVLAIVGGTLAASGTAALLAQRGYARPVRGVAVLVFPGAIMSLSWLGPDLLALGLVLWGLYSFRRERWVLAVACFTLAALAREFTLLVPAVLALHALLVGRSLPRAIIAGLPAIGFAAWMVVLYSHLGAFPWDAGADRLGAPFVGIGGALEFWSAADAVLNLANYLLVIIVIRRPRDPLSWVIAAVLAFSLTLGSNVWAHWRHVGRVFLLAQALAFVVVLAWQAPRRPPRQPVPSTRPGEATGAPPGRALRGDRA